MNDAHLLEGLRLDEPSAMERMMDKYQVYVYTIIRNVLGSAGNQADAEELVSDTFYAVWQHRGSIQPGKLRSYLCVTARNKAKSFLRSRRELPMDLDTIDLPDGGSSLEDQVIREERARLVRRAIRRMRPKDREIFLRYYYYLQNTEQIAQKMRLPASTVRSRLARGRKLLEKLLSEEGLP